ncbi:MAG: AarF/ABC1/UbiB kinase family protein, partial [Haloarculaceae archaeon]
YRVQQIVQQVEDTIYEFPFRLPSNLALVLRVATVVEGVCVTLDEDFDFIDVATDYLAEQGYVESTAREYVTDRADELQDAARSAVRVPPKLERVLDRADHEDLRVQANIRDSQNLLDRLAKRIIYGLLFASGVVSTALLYLAEEFLAAGLTAALAAFATAVLVFSFRRKRGMRAQPQFTRQSMRQRRENEP